LANDDQQQFVSCNTCEGLLLYSSLNGTNNLRTHLIHVQKKKNQVFLSKNCSRLLFFFKTIILPRKIKLSIIEACTEFCALDGRAFDVMKGDGFRSLTKSLLDASRTTSKLSIEIKDLLLHPTTVRIIIFK
jgi:hypothetical protein